MSMEDNRSVVPMHSGYKRKRDMSYNQGNDWYSKMEMMGSYSSNHTSNSDEHDIFGQYVASKLRKMDKSMQVLAERLISEALFKGQLGTLTKNSGIKDEDNKVTNSEDSQDVL